jgi:hypothetical protein
MNIAHASPEGLMKLIALLAFFLLVGAALAQDPPAPPAQQQQQSKDSVTLVGCLTKASTEGQYTVADSKTGQKITFTSAQPMDSYVNHTVQITGTMGDSGSGDKNFTPQTVKTVSDSCSGG